MEKSKIIEFLGSKKQYEEYKNLVINELKRQIQSNGLTQHFDERTNVYEEFAEMYLQGWMHGKKELIDELNELKNKVFSEEEIREYINENPTIPINIFEIMCKKQLSTCGLEPISPEENQQLQNYNMNPQLLSEEEAEALMRQQKEEKISEIMQYFNLEYFTTYLLNSNFIYTESNPITFANKRAIINVASMNEPSEAESKDFDVSEDQIVIAKTFNESPFILAYLPDNKYPQMLFSEFIHQKNEAEFKKDLRDLYMKYQGREDLNTLIRWGTEYINEKGREEI